jgi:uncharacterized membrane protein YqhA
VGQIARAFERALWASRLAIVVAVVASILAGVGALYMATVDIAAVLAEAWRYGDPTLPPDARDTLGASIVARTVKALDGYLLAAILFIFGLGLYELFVGKIEIIERSDFADRLLLIRTFDDLKDRLAKVVLLVLIVKFLQVASETKFATPTDLLALAAGIALVGAALYLSAPKSKPG